MEWVVSVLIRREAAESIRGHQIVDSQKRGRQRDSSQRLQYIVLSFDEQRIA